MYIIVLILVIFGVLWLLRWAILIAAAILAIPIAIFMLTPIWGWISTFFRRRNGLFFHRFWAYYDGYGPMYTKKNTVRALQRYISRRDSFGPLEGYEEDIEWAQKRLDALS